MGANITIQTHLLGGKRIGQIADPKTLGDDETINEALKMGYVVGKKESVASQVRGVLKSMLDGLSKDGDGRKIDNYFSIQAFANGRLDDVCDELDKTKIGIRAVARALKELTLDTSDWTITVEGATGTIVINAISTGEKTGEIVVGEDVAFNGKELAMSATDTLTWSVPGTSATGTVTAAQRTSDATRITAVGSAFSSLASAEYDGMTIVFVLTIGSKKVVKSATLRVAG